jgi:hypothetical protein
LRSTVSTRVLRLASLVLLGLNYVIGRYFAVPEVGETLQWTNGKADISAGSHPAELIWTVAAIALFAFLMVRRPGPTAEGVPSPLRRILAFLIDFQFSLFTTTGVEALIPLWLEAGRTGHFAWHFHRNYSANTDYLSVISFLFFAALMVLYFAFPLTRGRQTVGCFVVRIRVMPHSGNEGRFTLKAALVRTFRAFEGALSLLIRNRNAYDQGKTSYDRKTGCTVVLVSDE